MIPHDFDSRLAKAFAWHIWGQLGSRPNQLFDFSESEPIRLLAHNLNFWLPYVDMIVQDRIQSFGRTPFKDEEQISRFHVRARELSDGLHLERPFLSGDVWRGAADAEDATQEVIELADRYGNLRGIIDAVRSNRVEEDFSDRWSYVREDFERRLYHKRRKVKVSFVELDETIPVHGPESEVHENLLWKDFIAFLNPKEKQVVVCLRNGKTQLEIAQEMGYTNHSPVSKALNKIRKRVREYLED